MSSSNIPTNVQISDIKSPLIEKCIKIQDTWKEGIDLKTLFRETSLLLNFLQTYPVAGDASEPIIRGQMEKVDVCLEEQRKIINQTSREAKVALNNLKLLVSDESEIECSLENIYSVLEDQMISEPERRNEIISRIISLESLAQEILELPSQEESEKLISKERLLLQENINSIKKLRKTTISIQNSLSAVQSKLRDVNKEIKEL
eukprot:GHVP01066330.1.p1 GENE.GHVP01066330.1~~GHVP01066330.1.p1  ORF type:complete len:204 (+),score=42.45 GHVP01066330.1:61-672(+)